MARTRPAATVARHESWSGRLADAALIAALLGLAFLLGAFPQKDFDIWFHLRTGELIRQGQPIPSRDLYTYTTPDSRWIDLHWGFQVAASWIYTHAGFRGLNLAKEAVTCVALLLLVSARRRDWPVWVMVLAWLPALLVLGGRMYVRPETLSLLYLSGFLAVLSRWDRTPKLAFALPALQVLWVNTQGLFVLGPIVLAMALADAAIAPGALSEARKPWWRSVGLASLLTGLACLVNPYTFEGALFPVELAQTMNAKVFNEHIDELTSIPRFIHLHGWTALPLQLHFLTLALGLLSFLLPILWRLRTPPMPAGGKGKKNELAEVPGAEKARPKSRAKTRPAADRDATWRFRPFRALLSVAFGLLSLKATRNSHQFAAVFGAVTAWNFAEWAAAIRRRAPGGKGKNKDTPAGQGLAPRALAFAVLAAAMALVGSGAYYELTGEGRTVGMGEQPLWYPHAAAKFAGGPGMPARMLGFHLGYPALYEFYHGPSHKVFADPRLEVIGPDLYKRYLDAQERIGGAEPGWAEWLNDQGRPVIVADNASQSAIGATLMGERGSRWRCVWFDPVASVFLHEGDLSTAGATPVDFLARHFRPREADDPGGVPALSASATNLWALASNLQSRGRHDLARALVPLGLDHARRVRDAEPRSAVGWKLLGQLELARVPAAPGRVVPRAGMPFDPIADLGPMRGTYALVESLGREPTGPTAQFLLAESYRSRGLDDAALPLYERLDDRTPVNTAQRWTQARARERIAEIRARIGPDLTPPTRPNADALERAVVALLKRGRANSAADLLEVEIPASARSWAAADRLATLRLHLGDPAEARRAWIEAPAPADAAVRAARVALTHLVEGNFDAARKGYREALAADPALFEALYGLAVLEHDAGRAVEALAAAGKAVAPAPGAAAREAAHALAEAAKPYTSAHTSG